MPNWPNSIPHYLVGLHPDPGSIENRPRLRPVFLSPQVSNSIRVCEAILSVLQAVKPPLALLFCVCQRPSWPSFLVSQIEKIKFKGGGGITPSVLRRALGLGLTLVHATLPQWAGHPNVARVHYFYIVGTRCLLKAV